MAWLWSGEEPNGEGRIDFLTKELAVGSLVAASDLEVLTRHSIRAIVDASNREHRPGLEDRSGGTRQP